MSNLLTHFRFALAFTTRVRRERKFALLSAMTAAIAALPTGAALAQSRQFICSQGSTLTIQVEGPDLISVDLGDGDQRRLAQQDTAFDYSGSRMKLHIARNQSSVRIEQAGAESIHCIYPSPPGFNSGSIPVEGTMAKSWGGIVRDGPGLNFRKLANLREGDPIVLVEQTDVEMDGFPWFKITYDGSRTGFQWGGLICSSGRQVPGTFQQCSER